MENKLTVLMISGGISGGGASIGTYELATTLIKKGINVYLLLPSRTPSLPFTISLPPEKENFIQKGLKKISDYILRKYRSPFMQKIGHYLLATAHPKKAYYSAMGYEYFDFPNTYKILELVPSPVDIIHIMSNVGPGWFDWRAISYLSHKVPLIIQIRGAWPYTGHCSTKPPNCDRYKLKCYKCPYLFVEYRIKRDGCHRNVKVKEKVYKEALIHVVGVSRAIMHEVAESILGRNSLSSWVSGNGYNPDIFRPLPTHELKSRMDLSDYFVIGYSPGSIKNPIKGVRQFLASLRFLSINNMKVCVLIIGKGTLEKYTLNGIPESIEVRHIKYVNDKNELSLIYNTFDVYVHPSLYENFSHSILENMGCGKPVVAFNVGGNSDFCIDIRKNPMSGNSFLITPYEYVAMMKHIEILSKNPNLRYQMGNNSLKIARNYTIDVIAEKFIQYYEQIKAYSVRGK